MNRYFKYIHKQGERIFGIKLAFRTCKLGARSLMQKTFDIDWGFFPLVEFIVSSSNQIGSRYKTALDIGSGEGVHTEILRSAGLEVFN